METVGSHLLEGVEVACFREREKSNFFKFPNNH